MSVVSVVCCQAEVCVSGRSLVQRSPTDCGASECDREALIMRRPWPTRWLSCHEYIYIYTHTLQNPYIYTPTC
jgi:hypothetical protein